MFFCFGTVVVAAWLFATSIFAMRELFRGATCESGVAGARDGTDALVGARSEIDALDGDRLRLSFFAAFREEPFNDIFVLGVGFKVITLFLSLRIPAMRELFRAE